MRVTQLTESAGAGVPFKALVGIDEKEYGGDGRPGTCHAAIRKPPAAANEFDSSLRRARDGVVGAAVVDDYDLRLNSDLSEDCVENTFDVRTFVFDR
ncbi:MAG TPA: hypothetical protein VGG70_11550, partial [Candidatus Cybelea sp.]